MSIACPSPSISGLSLVYLWRECRSIKGIYRAMVTGWPEFIRPNFRESLHGHAPNNRAGARIEL